MEVLFWVLAVAGVIAVGCISLWLKLRRQRAFATMARQLGLAYTHLDPVGVLSLGFRLFLEGDGRGAENFLQGSWQGRDVVLFDYWYYEESTSSSDSRSRTYRRFSCAVTRVGAACSPLTVEPENVLTRIAGGLGFPDIEFESEAFNRRFRVSSPDRKFAYDFVDARMMQWLLSTGGAFSFETCGTWLLAYCDKLRPVEIVPLLGRTKGFAEQVPRVVASLYPVASSG